MKKYNNDLYLTRHFKTSLRSSPKKVIGIIECSVLLVDNKNINFIILNRYNYTNMGNVGNPYGLLQDSPIVYFIFF